MAQLSQEALVAAANAVAARRKAMEVDHPVEEDGAPGGKLGSAAED